MSTLRHTSQRQAIRQCFTDAGRPLSPQEVLAMAQASVPKLGLATVYRTLKALVEEGVLALVELPGEAPRYEPAGLEHHHHFHCRRCDRVFDVPGCGWHPPEQERRRGLGGSGNSGGGGQAFRVEEHEVWLTGLCGQCAEKPRR